MCPFGIVLVMAAVLGRAWARIQAWALANLEALFTERDG
jgi:hypothetical protein